MLGGGAALAAVLLTGPAALPQTQEERALAAVRAEIETVERRLEREHAVLEREYAVLKRVELDGAAAADALRELRGRLDAQRRRGTELAAETQRTHDRLDGERAALANQVRMSFLTGRQETIKLLLNQESPARLGRMMVYYDYLNRARSQRIAAVSRELATLAELVLASEQVTRELAALEREQQRKVEDLERLRNERQQAVVSLDATIDSDEAEIERLRQEERRLAELVRELEAALAEFPVDSQEPFTRNRGTLAWPVSGDLLNRFGDARAGRDIRWQGVQVAAPGGTPVRSIYHGRVVYSNWLPGLGLLIIVDHGEGYMSLYGHNEALLKEYGDWVAPGEVIAQVGDSGGQSRTSLYFEIRADGDPVDPQPWMGRAEPQRR